MARSYDAIVIGSGPNGLAAAITLARAGRSVLVREAQPTIGGGLRSAALTLPGFVHDVCSAIHPLGVASPFFQSLPLNECGLEWIQPLAAAAHPLDDGSAVMVERSVEATAANFGVDGGAYRKLMDPLASNWNLLAPALLGPPRFPRHPLALAGFGLRAMRSASGLAGSVFKGERARAAFAGMAAHSMLPLDQPITAAFGLVLNVLAHVAGWPFPKGGSQNFANALASLLRSLGGEIVAGAPVNSLDELPPARAILCDVTPRQLVALAGDRLSHRFQGRLRRYRYGVGVFKMDWALDAPIPWKAAECVRAATVHVGGTLEEVARSEQAAWQGRHAERPFVLVAQPSLFDATRAPAGKHTAWGYCHVPHGSSLDMSARIENQIERFAPGFRERVLARSVLPPAAMEQRNANLVGGDINGGVQDLSQLFFRPTAKLYSTSAKGLYICSASTPPGGGVHGMCGYFAASRALRDLW